MGAIRTNAAAAMLGVSPSTLRSWERRFGYPEPRRTAGGHRQFDLNEIEALRSRLATSVWSASRWRFASSRNALTKTATILMVIHLAGTFSLFLIAPRLMFAPAFPALTIEGEFVVKNIVLISSAFVILLSGRSTRA